MTVNFLGSLNPAERQAFTAVAEERTFARGARPMREGDQADYVMVIVSGWTRITIEESGRERVVAERGPGQLIGEVGALRVNARSATVTALETVRALVMKTEDFAGFLGSHQRVLALVDRQIDERLTSGPPANGWSGWHGADRAQAPPRPTAQAPPRPSLSGENCTVILTDVVGFGAHQRNDRDRLIIRGASLDMTQASLGPVWEKCLSEDQGDGLLVIAPPEIPTSQIMERLHRELPGQLRTHNRRYSESARMRLRVAANVGPVVSDSLGLSGEAIIRASRLLDAPALKDAMASTGASLGLIASAFVYDTSIRHAEGWADPERYRPVEVNVKESRIPAWMQLIDPSPPAPGPPGPLTPRPVS